MTEKEKLYRQQHGSLCYSCNYTAGLSFIEDLNILICGTCPKPEPEPAPEKPKRQRKSRKAAEKPVEAPPAAPEPEVAAEHENPVEEAPEGSEVVIDEVEPTPSNDEIITE